MRHALVLTVAAALAAASAAAAPPAAAAPIDRCPVGIQITRSTDTRTGPRSSFPHYLESPRGARFRVKKGAVTWWSSRRVNGWASLGGLEAGRWRHGPWVPPDAFRVVSDCDWRTP